MFLVFSKNTTRLKSNGDQEKIIYFEEMKGLGVIDFEPKQGGLYVFPIFHHVISTKR